MRGTALVEIPASQAKVENWRCINAQQALQISAAVPDLTSMRLTDQGPNLAAAPLHRRPLDSRFRLSSLPAYEVSPVDDRVQGGSRSSRPK